MADKHVNPLNCPVCGWLLAPDASSMRYAEGLKCPQCGAMVETQASRRREKMRDSLLSTMKGKESEGKACGRCGKHMPYDSAFCPHCGNDARGMVGGSRLAWIRHRVFHGGLWVLPVLVAVGVAAWLIYSMTKVDLDRDRERAVVDTNALAAAAARAATNALTNGSIRIEWRVERDGAPFALTGMPLRLFGARSGTARDFEELQREMRRIAGDPGTGPAGMAAVVRDVGDVEARRFRLFQAIPTRLRTDAQGAAGVPVLPPGDYFVTAECIASNRVLMWMEPVKVEARREAAVVLDLRNAGGVDVMYRLGTGGRLSASRDFVYPTDAYRQAMRESGVPIAQFGPEAPP